jgi:N-acetylmuramoyl-L-alanine amidase
MSTASKSPLPVQLEPLPYTDQLGERDTANIDLVVIHCTELPDLATAREYGERVLYPDSGTGNSGHYYLDRDGRVHRWIPHERIAHHTRGYNPRSIGVELVNTGRYPNWLDSRHQAMDEAYTDAQLDALLSLLRHLQAELPSLRWIAGHEDLDMTEVEASNDPTVMVRRKRDPGPLFPWDVVLRQSGLQRLALDA